MHDGSASIAGFEEDGSATTNTLEQEQYVEQASTDSELGDVAHVSGHGYVASHRCLAIARPSNSVELVDLDGGASTVLMEAPSQAAVAASALPGEEVLVVAAWGDVCARWRLARDGAGGWRVVAPRKTCAGLAAAGTILVAATAPRVARCAGAVVDILDDESLAPLAHFSVGGACRALVWADVGNYLAVAGAGGAVQSLAVVGDGGVVRSCAGADGGVHVLHSRPPMRLSGV